MTSLYGPLVGRKQVLDAIKRHLTTWTPDYFAWVARENDLDEPLAAIKSITYVAGLLRQWPENQLPCAVIATPGMSGNPVKDGDGNYRARWDVGIGVVLEARDRDAAIDLAGFYADAVSSIFLQHQKLGDTGRVVEWLPDAYDSIPAEKSRTLSVAMSAVQVEFRDVRNTFGGPTDPTVPPDEPTDPGDWPQIETTDIGITPVEEIA